VAKLTEEAAVKIGAAVTELLRQYTTEISKAIDDAIGEGKVGKVGFAIVFEPQGETVRPEVTLSFATGKKIQDSVVIDLKQTRIDL
jgi:hypothetical protein